MKKLILFALLGLSLYSNVFAQYSQYELPSSLKDLKYYGNYGGYEDNNMLYYQYTKFNNSDYLGKSETNVWGDIIKYDIYLLKNFLFLRIYENGELSLMCHSISKYTPKNNFNYDSISLKVNGIKIIKNTITTKYIDGVYFSDNEFLKKDNCDIIINYILNLENGKSCKIDIANNSFTMSANEVLIFKQTYFIYKRISENKYPTIDHVYPFCRKIICNSGQRYTAFEPKAQPVEGENA